LAYEKNKDKVYGYKVKYCNLDEADAEIRVFKNFLQKLLKTNSSKIEQFLKSQSEDSMANVEQHSTNTFVSFEKMQLKYDSVKLGENMHNFSVLGYKRTPIIPTIIAEASTSSAINIEQHNSSKQANKMYYVHNVEQIYLMSAWLYEMKDQRKKKNLDTQLHVHCETADCKSSANDDGIHVLNVATKVNKGDIDLMCLSFGNIIFVINLYRCKARFEHIPNIFKNIFSNTDFIKFFKDDASIKQVISYEGFTLRNYYDFHLLSLIPNRHYGDSTTTSTSSQLTEVEQVVDTNICYANPSRRTIDSMISKVHVLSQGVDGLFHRSKQQEMACYNFYLKRYESLKKENMRDLEKRKQAIMIGVYSKIFKCKTQAAKRLYYLIN